MRLLLVEQAPPVKSNESVFIVLKAKPSHLKVKTCLGELYPQKFGMNYKL